MENIRKNCINWLNANKINFSFNHETNIISVEGGNVYLRSYNQPFPENFQFNNGGYVDLGGYNQPFPENFQNGSKIEGRRLKICASYVKRFKLEKRGDSYVIFKRVSCDNKTQEGTENETLWIAGSVVEHPKWNPSEKECGEGKYHGCAKASWCDTFRSKRGDKYISILVEARDLYEWTNSPTYPQKIGFRKGVVLKEVNRN